MKPSSPSSKSPPSQKSVSLSSGMQAHEAGIMAETTLKLFFSLFVTLVATISLARLLPYHFAQSGKLKELRAQVKETEQRVQSKRQELQHNFDISQQEALMQEHSPRIAKNRVRVFWQDKTP